MHSRFLLMRSANHAAALAKQRSCGVHSYRLRFCVFTVSEVGPIHSLGHACLLDRLCRSLGSDNELELPAGSSSLAAAVTTGLAELEDEMFANLSRAAGADT
jgi:hypothetical protein